jgi:hypothetical protein
MRIFYILFVTFFLLLSFASISPSFNTSSIHPSIHRFIHRTGSLTLTMPLLRAMKLYEQDDSILIVSSDPAIKRALRITRECTSSSLQIEEVDRPVSLRGSSLVIFGIIGFINLNAGMQLLVITASTKVGKLFGKDIFRVHATQLVSLAAKNNRVSAAVCVTSHQHSTNTQCIRDTQP